MVGKTAPGMRLGTLYVTMLLAISSCSGSASEPATTAPTSSAPTTTTTTAPPPETTTSTTTTTTLASTTTTIDPLARPDVLVSNPNRQSADDFDPTGDDVWTVMLELRDLFVFLEGNPSGTAEQMAALVFEPSYPYWEPIVAGFDELVTNPGWRYTDPGVETLGIELLEAQDDVAVIRLADRRAEQIISDADGSVVKTYEGWEPKVTTITLKRGEDSRWRYADLEPSEPVTPEELSNMVPVDWTGRTV